MTKNLADQTKALAKGNRLYLSLKIYVENIKAQDFTPGLITIELKNSSRIEPLLTTVS
jgi:hypothetical protein